MTSVALIFPGQGAQSVGMGREFYEFSDEARAIFDAADEIITGLKEVAFNGPAEKLTSTKYCQPAIFTYSYAAYEALKAHAKFDNIDVKYAAGLSLGECTAVAASEALDFEEALMMVQSRAEFMEEACRLEKGSMAAVIGLGGEKIAAICKECGAQVANYNSPEQIVVTGSATRVAVAVEAIKQAGAKRVIALDVGGAFHSQLMAPAVPKFESVLRSLRFRTPGFPVVSNVDGLPVQTAEAVRNNLAKQIISSVQWVRSVQFIAKAGVTTFLEIGPGTVLKGLIRKINPELTVHNIQKPEDIESLVV
jgi:[acyl-carrier-protein] S-malonyltransferase